jgi:hypothetical protein
MPTAARGVTSPASTSSDSGPVRRRTRVSAEHTLNRVRENQRRHRARQKDHVASLEQKLADTEKLLAEARAEITALKAEQAAASAICQLNQMKQLPESVTYSQETTSTSEVPESAPTLNEHQPDLTSVPPDVDVDPQLDDFPDCPINNLSFLGDTIPPALFITPDALQSSTESDNYPGGPPPCCPEASLSPPPEEHLDPQCSTCKTRPLPDPAESTTLCAQAYVMISQQNFRNLDPETIRMWLAKGYRRAQREGEGCRVENGALLRLLDYISGL